jgi:hypothetical protein
MLDLTLEIDYRAGCPDGRDIQELQLFGSALLFHSNGFHKMPPFAAAQQCEPGVGHEQAQRLELVQRYKYDHFASAPMLNPYERPRSSDSPTA